RWVSVPSAFSVRPNLAVIGIAVKCRPAIVSMRASYRVRITMHLYSVPERPMKDGDVAARKTQRAMATDPIGGNPAGLRGAGGATRRERDVGSRSQGRRQDPGVRAAERRGASRDLGRIARPRSARAQLFPRGLVPLLRARAR